MQEIILDELITEFLEESGLTKDCSIHKTEKTLLLNI